MIGSLSDTGETFLRSEADSFDTLTINIFFVRKRFLISERSQFLTRFTLDVTYTTIRRPGWWRIR